MQKELVSLKDLTSEMSMTTRVMLGCFLCAMIGVFIPLFAINLTGTWLGSISAYGDHIIIGSACVLTVLIGLNVKRLWIGVLIVWIPVFGIQFFGLFMSKPVNDWLSAWPAFARTFGAILLPYAFLAWYRREVLEP